VSTGADEGRGEHRRRPRYAGAYPRRFDQKYKEHAIERHPDLAAKLASKGHTPAGTHVPILVDEVQEALALAPGQVVVDATLGYGGHARRLAERVAPDGLLIGLDVDGDQLERTRARLADAPAEVRLFRRNFRDLPGVLAELGLPGVDGLLADLGVSSMQLDDPARGFSFRKDGPLDLRLDPRLPRTAADWLARLSEEQLRAALEETADEPDATAVARAVQGRLARGPLTRTRELSELVLRAKGLDPVAWRERAKAGDAGPHPAARTFQALRILVNDELGVLAKLLRTLPRVLNPGGRVAILSFHSGEDRRVKEAFRDGLSSGVYAEVSDEPVRASKDEVYRNNRAAPARLRFARKAP
jgi:16S rRNA (cytosine1402-N4)-methyltransferase